MRLLCIQNIWKMNRLFCLLDIMAGPLTFMRRDNAVPNAATCRSLELGVIRCIDETAEQVRRNTGLSVTETQIERVLRGIAVWQKKPDGSYRKTGRKYIERRSSAVTESA